MSKPPDDSVPWDDSGPARDQADVPDNRALFQAATRLQRLEEGWQRVRLNAGAAGGDGVTIERFGEAPAVRLITLQRALQDGSYAPGPLRRLEIAKPDGGVRPLAIPCVVDRVAQTAVALTLTPVLDPTFSEDSFGYRPGRSVQQAVHRVAACRDAGFRWVVDADIAQYFERVPHAPLLDRLTAALGDGPLTELIALWLETGAPTGVGLPQGAPLSPLLANLYLDALDDALAGRGVRLVRFADDFVLLCRDRDRAEQVLERTTRLLAEHGLALNPDKTRVVSFEHGFRFLGHLFLRALVLASPNRLQDAADAADIDATLRRLAGEDAAAALRRQETEASASALDTAGFDRVLRVLYLTEPVRRLNLRNQAFTVEERTDRQGVPTGWRELAALPPQRVDRVELYPGAEASLPALRHAVALAVPVAFVNGHGETLGLLASPADGNARRQLDQAQCGLDPVRRCDLARRLVDGRIRNQRALLRRLNRTRQDKTVVEAVLAMNRTLKQLPLAADVEALLGHEGAAAARLWGAFPRLLRQSWGFDGRLRRPPPDPINAVLSLLSGLLERDIGVLVRRHGLHPGFGALHSARDGHDACVYDLMEEFRAPLVEGLTVYLANNRMVEPADFSRPEAGRCRIGRDALQAIIRGYEAWLDRPVQSPRTKRRILWRRLMEEQVVAYATHMAPEGAAYRPYVMDY